MIWELDDMYLIRIANVQAGEEIILDGLVRIVLSNDEKIKLKSRMDTGNSVYIGSLSKQWVQLYKSKRYGINNGRKELHSGELHKTPARGNGKDY